MTVGIVPSLHSLSCVNYITIMHLHLKEILLAIFWASVTSSAFILDATWKGECFDKVGSCSSLGREVCTREHEQWARQYCPAHCGYCDPSQSHVSHACRYKNVTYHQGQTWEDGCDYKCTCVDAANNFYMCTDYCLKHESEDTADECYWGKVPFKCCEVLLCPKTHIGTT